MPVHLAARTFLTEFGGLQVRSIIPDGGRKLEYWADFDVRLALTWIGARDRQLLGDLLGPGLSPIGVTCGGTLWISERSEIVGEYLLFDTVTRSRSVEEAFERLFAGRLPDYETYTVDDNGTPVGVSIAPWASDEGDKT